MGRLDGKTALITGGGSGIGRAIVDRYMAEGASIGVLELNPDRVEELQSEYDDDVVAVQGDVTNFEDNQDAVSETVNTFGQLDIFVGNAGLLDDFAHLNQIQPDELEQAFDEQFHVNVMGYMMGAKAALPELITSEGNMVFTASFASWHPNGGGILYTASKHAVAGIIHQLAFELAPKIRVNGVAPGYASTNLGGLESLTADTDFESGGQGEVENPYPLEPNPSPENYAGYYVFLASDSDARNTTGEIINADSGLGIRGIKDIAGGRNL